MIKRTPVKSGNIAEIGFDPATNTLAVLFKNGGLYHYAGVDSAKHAALMGADSIGKHLHANIRGQHQHSKIDPE